MHATYLKPANTILHHQIHFLLFLIVQHVQQLDHIAMPQYLQQLNFATDILLAIGYPLQFALCQYLNVGQIEHKINAI